MFWTCSLLMLAVALPIESSNKHFSSTLTTSASPETIWQIWTDVPNWKNWDTGLQDASMASAWELGAKGKILSLEGRKAKFKVVEWVPQESYTYKTQLPLARLYVKRSLKTEAGQTIFTHEVWFTGLLGGIFAKALGTSFREMLPGVLKNIKEIAES